MSSSHFEAYGLLGGLGRRGHIPSSRPSTLQHSNGNHGFRQYTPSHGRQTLLLHVLRARERAHTRSAVLKPHAHRRVKTSEGVYPAAFEWRTQVAVPLSWCRGRALLAFKTSAPVSVDNGITPKWAVRPGNQQCLGHLRRDYQSFPCEAYETWCVSTLSPHFSQDPC